MSAGQWDEGGIAMIEMTSRHPTLVCRRWDVLPPLEIMGRAEPEAGEASPLTPLTWPEMCAIEPRLVAVEQRARAVSDDGSAGRFCANVIWARQFKPVLYRLVGFGAQRPELRSHEAYDLAYQRLYALLPPCRDCLCL